MQGQPSVNGWGWFWRELRPYRRMQALSTLCLLGSTLLSLLDPILIKWIIDEGLLGRRWSTVVLGVMGIGLVFVARMGFVGAFTATSSTVLERLMLRLRLRLVRITQRQDASFFERNPIGEIVARIDGDVEQVGQIGTNLVPTVVRIVFSSVATVSIMLVLNPALTLLTAPMIPLFFLLRRRFHTRMEVTAEATRSAFGERASLLNELVSVAMQAQVLRAEPVLRRRYTGQLGRTVRAMKRQRTLDLTYSTMIMALFTLVTCSVLLAGAWQVTRGALTLGGYIAFYSYLARLYDPLGVAAEVFAGLKRAGASINRILELERIVPRVSDRPTARAVDASSMDAVRCEEIAFGYEEERPILRGARFSLRRGERVALIGRSGSGKSTMAKLLVRLHDPQAGAVLLGEWDYREATLANLRATVALVPSSPLILRGTMRENLLMGTRTPPVGTLDRLARVAGFDTVLARLPGGWEHTLGAGGGGLSDGERQRFGLLRALVRDPEVLIMDEATGALDPIVEAQVLERLAEHLRDRMLLLITHRPAAALWADRVLLLRDGRLHPVALPGNDAPVTTTDLYGLVDSADHLPAVAV